MEIISQPSRVVKHHRAPWSSHCKKGTISVLFWVMRSIWQKHVLRISKLTDYAIVAMTFLAESPGDRFTTSEVASEVRLETTTIAKILKLLAASGLVRSYRGVNGGYQLAKSAAAISMADIITVMEGPIGMTECSVHEGLCAQEAVCNTRSNWRRISEAIEAALSAVSLAEMTGSVGNLDARAQLHIRLANK